MFHETSGLLLTRINANIVPSEQFRTKGPSFGPPPEEAFDVFASCGSLREQWSPVILDYRMQISDLKAWNLSVKYPSTSICNLQSQIINHTSSAPKDQVFCGASVPCLTLLARIFHELLSRDHATRNPLAGLSGAERARRGWACHLATVPRYRGIGFRT
jgi:hypothetical protein